MTWRRTRSSCEGSGGQRRNAGLAVAATCLERCGEDPVEEVDTGGNQPEPERLRGSEEEEGIAPEAEVEGERGRSQSPTAKVLKVLMHVAVAGWDPESL